MAQASIMGDTYVDFKKQQVNMETKPLHSNDYIVLKTENTIIYNLYWLPKWLSRCQLSWKLTRNDKSTAVSGHEGRLFSKIGQIVIEI